MGEINGHEYYGSILIPLLRICCPVLQKTYPYFRAIASSIEAPSGLNPYDPRARMNPILGPARLFAIRWSFWKRSMVSGRSERAPFRHTSTHRPQPIHREGSTEAMVFTEMAFRGQAFSHEPQPIHDRGSTTALKATILKPCDRCEIPKLSRWTRACRRTTSALNDFSSSTRRISPLPCLPQADFLKAIPYPSNLSMPWYSSCYPDIMPQQ